MTIGKLTTRANYLDTLAQRFDASFKKKVSANEANLVKLKKELESKKKKVEARITRHLARLEKKYEGRQWTINHEYETQVEKLNQDVVNAHDLKFKLDASKRLHDKSLSILKKEHEREVQRLTQTQKLAAEECTWVLDDFKKTTGSKLEALKKSRENKFKLRRSRLIFQKNFLEKKLALQNKLASCTEPEERLIYKKQLRTLATQLYHDEPGLYVPFQIKMKHNRAKLALAIRQQFTQGIEKIKLLRLYSFKKLLHLPIFGCPLYLYLLMLIIAIVAVATKTVSSDIVTGLGMLLIFSMIVGTIFNNLPIWKTYLGGGAVACFVLSGIIGHTFNVIPPVVQSSLRNFYAKESGGNFLSFYVVILLSSSILAMPRKMIATAVGKYGFFIILTILLSGIIGYGIGRAMGLASNEILLRALAPVYGGGNATGAIPMSQMGALTGYATEGHDEFYAKLLIIVVVANIFMIVFSSILSPMGNSAKLSGNGKIVRRSVFIPTRDESCTDRHILIALVLYASVFILAHTLQVVIQKNSISHAFRTGIIISQFAWVVIFVLILNISGIVPEKVINGSKRLSTFVSKQFTLIVMTGAGLGIDFKSLAQTFDIRLLWVAIITCCLLLIIPLALADVFGMFPFESMLGIGVSLGGMGVTGAVACLSATNRMELMSYSQISIRLSATLMLIIVSPLYSIWAPH